MSFAAERINDQAIYEVTPAGEMVWKWLASDHLEEFGFSPEGLEQVRKALPHLSGEKLIERYFGESDGSQSLRLGEGLRLAEALPDNSDVSNVRFDRR